MTSIRNLAPTADFGFDVLRKQIAEKKGENVFVSPLSISLALGMTANGADGSTFKAMQKALRLSDYGDDGKTNNAGYASLIAALTSGDLGVKMKIANSIWARKGANFKEEFLKANEQFFKAEVSTEDFSSPAASPKMNDWVSKGTEGKITKIVPDVIDPNTVMFLINAIYFKGEFAEKFDKASTRTAKFNAPAGEKDVKMMFRNADIRYSRTEDYQMVALPFGGAKKRFSLFVLLPNSGKTAEEVAGGLTSQKFFEACKNAHAQDVVLNMPKFEIEYSANLNDTLQALGMSEAFSSGTANFKRMGEGALYISDVEHKVYARVDEEGAEAAAATSVSIGLECISMPKQVMVDRPFITLIADEDTGAVAFAGLMNSPDAPK